MSLEDYADKAVGYALQSGCQYCDARAETVTSNGFLLENGEIEHFTSSSDFGLGIRVLAAGCWGFYSVSNPLSLEEIKNAAHDAVKSALHYSKSKKQKVKLADAPTFIDKVDFRVLKQPAIEEMTRLGFECDNIIKSKKAINKSSISMEYDVFSKYFINSDGTKIHQNFVDTIANLSATAHESGLTESVNTTEGGRGGMEMILGQNDITNAAEFIAQKASQLIDAKTAKEDKATVVMNPDFVALLAHEILGHPSEADRVLGKEMAWAGGAWWAGKLGEKVGSSKLTVIDDPTIPGNLGWYKYDDEGVFAKRKTLIENGVLINHMQSRETASIFNTEPNSGMRASGYEFMPLIRMACTCIRQGDWDPQEMIKEVKNGYLISNMKVPSIDMMRYNWSISCQFAQKIENGEPTELLRDVIVMGTAPEFFNSIDACGKDFTVRPVTNCGKGDPMQTMRMGNGGPHIRGVATVKSVGA
ncbi:MAG: TldD/PmbA family protein [Nitrosopumilaceae archaeon]